VFDGVRADAGARTFASQRAWNNPNVVLGFALITLRINCDVDRMYAAANRSGTPNCLGR